MHRRTVLKSAAMLAASSALESRLDAFASSPPAIDAHIHLYDPTRPGGVPWPETSDAALYRPALPARYQALAAPHGVIGAIAIECSPWIGDNFWLLDVAERDPVILGVIGDLAPDGEDFRATLALLHRNPLFRGIRYGNLWDRDLGAASTDAKFLEGLRALADADLILETANPNPALIAAALRVADRVPRLRIVIDHLPQADVPGEVAARAQYEADLRHLAAHPNVFVKGSEILRKIGGAQDSRVPLDSGFYRAGLDHLWEIFGEDRIFFGSDWPNSDHLASYADTFRVAQDYMAGKSLEARQKYFWKNSIAVYKWHPRTAAQTTLLRS